MMMMILSKMIIDDDNWLWYWWCQWQCCECSVCERRHTDFGGLNTQSSVRHSSNIFNAVSHYLEWPQCLALSHHVDMFKGKIGIVLLPQMNLCPRLCVTGIVNNLHSWSFKFNLATLGQQGQLRQLGRSWLPINYVTQMSCWSRKGIPLPDSQSSRWGN